jgi:hypothetical protein
MLNGPLSANATPKRLWPLLTVTGLLLLLHGSLLAQSTQPSAVGQWSTTERWPKLAVHAHMLANGKVLFWPSFAQGDNPTFYDPVANTFAPATQAGFNIFCSGHTFLPDGKLFVAGGHVAIQVGLRNAAVYDPASDAWTQLPEMEAGRWYPTATTLSNGDVLVTSGDITPKAGENGLPQIWQNGPQQWLNLNSAILALPNYPRNFVAPNGKVFNAGSYTTTRYLDPNGTGTWSIVGSTRYKSTRDYGTAVMYEAGKVLIAGGSDPPTKTAEVIDLNASKPAWQFSNSMAYPRRQLNATILPDGRVLVTGGSSGKGFNNSGSPVFAAEVWDPATGQWSTWASSTAYRGYHSVALLLPDGRVLSAGGDSYTEASGEIYSPPYLFNGTRPTLTSAPAQVNYGQNFFVATPDAASIAKVTWVKLTSVTHSFNSNQRFNNLSFTQASGGLNVTAPSGPTLATPGQYMLFILNGSGVPSIAQIVQIGAAAPNVISVSPPSGATDGNTPVTISGNNFLAGATVQIGGVMATKIQVAGSTTITANTPAHSPGAADVVVTNPDYQKGTLSGGYNFASEQGISFAQVNTKTVSKSVTSVTLPYPMAQSAGDLNIVVVGWNDATATIGTVTDSSGNQYAPAAAMVTGVNLRQAIYYAKNISAAGAGANTVIVKFTKAASFPDVRIFEYQGLDTANPLDVTNGSSGTSFTASSGQVTTKAAEELVFASDTVLSKTLSPGPGYVPIILTKFFDIAEHQISSQKGNFNPSASLNASSNWVMQVVTFKASSQ